jgi:hypothetical protein
MENIKKMKKLIKPIFYILILLNLIYFLYQKTSLFSTKKLIEKPIGPYNSSKSITESISSRVFIADYKPSKLLGYASDKKSSFKFKEIWIEKNTNDPQVYESTGNYKYILNIKFKYLTDNNLHKFRLLNNSLKQIKSLKEKQNEIQTEHPDGGLRVRYLLHQIQDTFQLEIIERNPKDKLNWQTEKVIDTVYLIKKN